MDREQICKYCNVRSDVRVRAVTEEKESIARTPNADRRGWKDFMKDVMPELRTKRRVETSGERKVRQAQRATGSERNSRRCEKQEP